MATTPAEPRARKAASLGDARLRRFAMLMELEKKVRQAATRAEVGFLIVNETWNLARYRQAVLWEPGEGNGRVMSISGLASPDHNAPFVVWIRKLLAQRVTTGMDRGAQILDPATLSAEVRKQWGEWLPEHVLLVPLWARDGKLQAVLLLARESEWAQGERVLLENLADAYGHVWHALRATASWWDLLLARRKRALWVTLAVLVALALVPVRHSALAPAEVIARDPVMVVTSVDGVIEDVRVRPNQLVEQGQLLVQLDDARIANQLALARSARDVAGAEVRQASQQAVFDRESAAMLEILRGRLAQHEAEVRYYQSLLERVEIRAPRAGVVVFDDVNDLLGRPVSLGERVMMLASPEAVELEIHLSTTDAIRLADDAQVRLFLNTAAHQPIDATLSHMSYQANATPAGHFAYRLVAQLDDPEQTPRIGLQGSARVYGDRTVLIAYVLRRPLSALRRIVGA